MTARAPQAPGLRRLAASGVLAGVLAAAGTTAVAALARGLGVSLEAGSVPLLGRRLGAASPAPRTSSAQA